MKFTKEEKSLCKQVAEKHKKEVKYGDWILYGNNKPRLITEQPKEIQEACYSLMDAFIPLWTISDCLEFLREKGYRVKTDDTGYKVNPFHVNCYRHKTKIAFFTCAMTRLEACLKAVLAVFEEEGK